MAVGSIVEDEEDGVIRPFRRLYFSDEMVSKYEPLATAMKTVMESEGKDDDAWEDYQNHLAKFKNYEWCSTWDGNRYDIVFYGVSGYTGYLMMEYLKRVSFKKTPESFTFAFAGRSRTKVMEMRDRELAGTKHEDAPILQMSYDDIFSIVDLVKSARVIINVAGPYMLTQGELLVDACISMGVHYVDISGEIPWSLRIKDLHKHALKAKVCVVPSAATAGGFPDLGVYLCAKKMRAEYNEGLRHAICYCSGGGASAGSSGGTLKTRAAMNSAGDDERKRMADPFSLGGFVPDRDRWGMKACSIEFGTGKVTTKMRSEDMDANFSKISEDKKLGVWRGPFQYSWIDTRIVRRSNMLLADLGNCPYGSNLNFMEYAMLPTEAILGKKPQGGGVSVESEKASLQASGKYYKEGEGPALEELEDAWTGFFLWAETEKGHEVKCSFVGRDAYFETARVAVETAMCLCFDGHRLPYPGGVLTAAVACGDFLAQRMIDSGVKFKMGDWLSAKDQRPPPFP